MKHQNKTLIFPEFVSMTFQNIGYTAELTVQYSLLLVLNDNCWFMPLVHLILTANLDFMLHFLGDPSLTKDTFAYTLVQVVSISGLMIYQHQIIKNGRSRYESDRNAFLVSDQFTSNCSLLAVAEIQDIHLTDTHSAMSGLEHKLMLRVLRQDHQNFRTHEKNGTVKEICFGINSTIHSKILDFLKDSFNFKIMASYFEIPQPDDHQQEPRKFLKIVEHGQILELEYIRRFNILKINVKNIELKQEREVYPSQKKQSSGRLAQVPPSKKQSSKKQVQAPPSRKLSSRKQVTDIPVSNKVKNNQDILPRLAFPEIKQVDRRVSESSCLSFAELVDGQIHSPLSQSRRDSIDTLRNIRKVAECGEQVEESNSVHDISSSDKVVNRKQTKEKIEQPQGPLIIVSSGNSCSDDSFSNSSDQGVNQSMGSQEPKLKMICQSHDLNKNQILSNSVSCSSDTVQSKKSRCDYSPATQNHLKKKFQSTTETPVNLSNLRHIIAGEIKSQSARIKKEQESKRSQKSMKSVSGASSPFERVCKSVHILKVAKLQAQLKNNKTYLNMAVHDMRNPTNAITFGVNETLQMLRNQKKKIESMRKMRKQRRQFINSQFRGIKQMGSQIRQKNQNSSPSESRSSRSNPMILDNNSSFTRKIIHGLDQNQSEKLIRAKRKIHKNRSQSDNQSLNQKNKNFQFKSQNLCLKKQEFQNSNSDSSNQNQPFNFSLNKSIKQNRNLEEVKQSVSQSGSSQRRNKPIINVKNDDSSDYSDDSSSNQQVGISVESPISIEGEERFSQIIQRNKSPSSNSSLSFRQPRRNANSYLPPSVMHDLSVSNEQLNEDPPIQPMEIGLIEQQCDFEDIDEMVAQHQPKVQEPHNNGIQRANNQEFFTKIKLQLEKQVQKYSGDSRQLNEIQASMRKCQELCQDLQVRDRLVISDPPLKNLVSREVQCDAPIALLDPAPQAIRRQKHRARPRRAMSQNMYFDGSTAKYNKKIQCNLDLENLHQDQYNGPGNFNKNKITQMKKKIEDQAKEIEIQKVEIKSLKQQLGKQGAIIEYQDENLKEIEQQCVLEKSFMEKIEKFLQNAVFSATMLGNLINDMLDLAKFESGTFKFHNDFFDLIEVIEQAFETIRYQAERKEIKVSYKVLDHRGVPQKKIIEFSKGSQHNSVVSHLSNQEKEDISVIAMNDNNTIKSLSLGHQASDEVKNMFYQLYGDKNRYTQMVLNFLSNSVHYTKKGGEIIINLILLEEQIIKPRGQNATHSLVDLEDLIMCKRMIGMDEGQAKILNDKNGTYASGGMANKWADQSSLRNILSQSHGNQSLKDRADKLQIESSKQDEDLQPAKSIEEIGKIEKLESFQQSKFVKFRLEINDTGVGIKKEDIGKLFCDFSRLDQGMNNTGTGLGLSICKKMIEKMGGKVGVESEWGVGTTFSITLQTKSIPMQKLKSNDQNSDLSVSNNQNSNQSDDEILMSENCNSFLEQSINNLNCKRKSKQSLNNLFNREFRLLEELNSSQDSSFYMSSQPMSKEQYINPRSCRLSLDGQNVSDVKSISQSAHSVSSCISMNNIGNDPQALNLNTFGKHSSIGLRNQLLADINEAQEHSGASNASDQLQNSKAINRKVIAQVQSLSKSIDMSSSHELSSKRSGNQDVQSKGLFSFGIGSNRKKPLQASLQSFDLSDEMMGSQMIEIDEQPEESKNELERVQPLNQSQRMLLPQLPMFEVKQETFKCLVANDCEFQLMQIGLILRNAKIEVTEAINGLEALEHVTVSKKRFDFILLDLGMPIMDGFDACKQIVAHYSDEHKLIGQKQLQGSSKRFEEFVKQHQDQNEILQKSQKLLELFEEVGQQPILVALSALITDDIKEKCIGVGFTEVLESPLTSKKVEEILKQVRVERQIQSDFEQLIQQQEELFGADNNSFDDLDNPSLRIPQSVPKSMNQIMPPN